MLDDKKKYIYFTGDFFWSENDSNDVVSLIKNSFNDGYIILNAEGSLKSTETSKIIVQKKCWQSQKYEIKFHENKTQDKNE